MKVAMTGGRAITRLRETVAWYLENPQWWWDIRNGRFAGDRLGLMGAPVLA